jgi:ADP-ribose pyrophosphatase YjhB (NUDIX family)
MPQTFLPAIKKGSAMQFHKAPLGLVILDDLGDVHRRHPYGSAENARYDGLITQARSSGMFLFLPRAGDTPSDMPRYSSSMTASQPQESPPDGTIFYLAGYVPSVAALRERIDAMLAAHISTAVVTDCLFCPGHEVALAEFFLTLHELRVDSVKSRYLLWLQKSDRHIIRVYPHWETSAAQVVLLVPDGDWQREPHLLAIRRKKGRRGLALPSGFQHLGESLEAAGARETEEETGYKIDPNLSEILLVDSDHRRDAGCYALEADFLYLAYRGEEEVWGLQPLVETDEAAPFWTTPTEFVALPAADMAFENHRQAVIRAMTFVRREQWFDRLLRLIPEGCKYEVGERPSERIFKMVPDPDRLPALLRPSDSLQ